MNHLNLSEPDLLRVSRRAPCPICGKPDWCGTSADGSLAICMRASVGATSAAENGGFVHLLREREKRQPIPLPPRKPAAISLAPIAQRHAAYTALLDSLTLSGKHANDLLRRGLHDIFTANNLFASTPGNFIAEAITARLSARYDLRGVPGFYCRAGEWRLNLSDWHAGYLIPVRDLAGRIQALQIRRDAGEPRYCWLSSKGKPEGMGSGSPIHFAASHRLKSGAAIITEGD